jgi:hypothetical protein
MFRPPIVAIFREVFLKDMWWYGYKLPDARAIVYAHNTLFLFVPTISATGRMLAARLSRVSLYTASLAVLTCTRSC